MILTKQITTAKATIIVIGGLPEDTGYVTIILGSLFYAKEEGDWSIFDQHNMPKGKWKPLGFLNKIPEDVAKELVDDKYRYFPEKHQIFRNYKKPLTEPKVWFSGEGWNQSWNDPFGTATESLHSLVEANCKLENPLGEKPVKKISGGLLYLQNYEKAVKEWEAEQTAVFTHPYLLKKID